MSNRIQLNRGEACLGQQVEIPGGEGGRRLGAELEEEEESLWLGSWALGSSSALNR